MGLEYRCVSIIWVKRLNISDKQLGTCDLGVGNARRVFVLHN